jgi:hypothetical protein
MTSLSPFQTLVEGLPGVRFLYLLDCSPRPFITRIIHSKNCLDKKVTSEDINEGLDISMSKNLRPSASWPSFVAADDANMTVAPS